MSAISLLFFRTFVGMFSKACEYGIKATLFVASQSLQGKRTILPEIAVKIDSPVAFTAKILQQLARHKVIHSFKGPNGGFFIFPESLTSLKLKDIVTAIDGDAIVTECALGLKKCDENSPCPIHYKFKSIRKEIIDLLENVTLKELSEKIEKGDTVLKI